MNLTEAKTKALNAPLREDREEAVETLYAVAIERDEMARQAEYWYNQYQLLLQQIG